MIDNSFWNGKTAIVTGHTGFKGSWLTACLKNFKSKVFGISNNIPTKPSHYKLSRIHKNISEYRIDIRNYSKLKKNLHNLHTFKRNLTYEIFVVFFPM